MGKKKKSKGEEYKEKLQKQTIADKELAGLPTTTLKAILADTDQVEYVRVPGRAEKLPYKRLKLKAFVKLQTEGLDRMELVYKMLFEMLHSADETITEEDVGNLPFDMASDLVTGITEATGFLPAKRSQA